MDRRSATHTWLSRQAAPAGSSSGILVETMSLGKKFAHVAAHQTKRCPDLGHNCPKKNHSEPHIVRWFAKISGFSDSDFLKNSVAFGGQELALKEAQICLGNSEWLERKKDGEG